jgi:hypothetical protein
MSKKLTLACCIFLAFYAQLKAQSTEGKVFEITSRVEIFLPSTNQAVLEGSERFIQIGLLGNQNDKQDLIGYIDRFIVNDKDMTLKIVPAISEEMIDYYKFYLDPLYDANNFQKMLEMLGVKKFHSAGSEHSVTEFSNMIYASIKSRNK